MQNSVQFCRINKIIRCGENSIAGIELLAGGISDPAISADGWRAWYRRMADDFIEDLLDDHGLVLIHVTDEHLSENDIFLNLMHFPAPRRIIIELLGNQHSQEHISDRSMKRIEQLRKRGFKLAVKIQNRRSFNMDPPFKLPISYARLGIDLISSWAGSARQDDKKIDTAKTILNDIKSNGCQIIADFAKNTDDLALLDFIGVEFATGTIFPTKVMKLNHPGYMPGSG